MRQSKLIRKMARALGKRPWTRAEMENMALDGVLNTFAKPSKGMFTGGANAYDKRIPQEPTGREFPASMFVKNDTTAYLAKQKERRAMIRGKI